MAKFLYEYLIIIVHLSILLDGGEGYFPDVVTKPCHAEREESEDYEGNSGANRCQPFDYDCVEFVQYIVVSERITCRYVNQNELDYIFKQPTSDKKHHPDFKRTIIVTDSSIPILHTLETKSISIDTLELSNLNISKIVPGFFVGIVNLTTLFLEKNSLTEIPDGTLSPLNQLEKLDLSQNKLEQLTEHTFAGLISLNELKLNQNNISKISPNTFFYNKKLSIVNLSQNRIETVPLIYSYVYLNSMDLSFNNISVINISCSIHTIDVSYNSIYAILNLNKDLHVFKASHNKISNISDVFSETIFLSELDLSYNNLTDLPINSFKSLEGLRTLDLSYNQLTGIRFGILNSLPITYLNIEGNKLSTLSVYTFPVHSLTTFYFAKNFINDFDVNAFPVLRDISFDGPGWQCTNLAKTVNILKSKNIMIKTGLNFDTENIEGIACTDEAVTTKYEGNEMKPNSQNNFENYSEKNSTNIFYKYLEGLSSSAKDFDKNFATSNLFQYFQKIKNESLKREDIIIEILNKTLEKDNNFHNNILSVNNNVTYFLNKVQNILLNNSFINYTGKNVSNANYDTLERSTNIHNNLLSISNNVTYFLDRIQNILFNNTFINYIGKNFTNTDFYKYLESFKNVLVPSNNTYFNDNFKNSNFYKYMENFKSSPNTNSHEAAKLIQTKNEEVVGNSNGVTYVNLISNILQVTTLLFFVYAFIAFKKYVHSHNQQNSSEQNIQLV